MRGLLRSGTRPTSFRSDLRTVARGWRWTHRPLVPRSVEPPAAPAREFPTAWARTEAGRAARAIVQGSLLAPLLRFEVDARAEGLDVLDDLTPPVIFIANHTSHLDAPLILTTLPPAWRARTATGAAADYFFDVWWRAAATALVFNAFPVERSGSKGRTTRLARELLTEGWNLLVFPEGTRSRDGWVSPFRLGAARLAVETGTPVVPVAVRGSYQAMPRGRSWPAKGRPPVRLRFGRPVRPGEDEDPAAFAARMRHGIAIALEEDRTSWWDALRRGPTAAVIDAGGPLAAPWRRVWEASRPMPRARRAFR